MLSCYRLDIGTSLHALACSLHLSSLLEIALDMLAAVAVGAVTQA